VGRWGCTSLLGAKGCPGPSTRSGCLSNQPDVAQSRIGSVSDWLYPYICGAGRGARKKYSAASKRWRKRVFRRPHIITAVLVAAIIVLISAVPGHGWIAVAGAGLGLLLGVYLTLLESPPGYIENWRTGAEGERRTARALAPLRRRGYKLLHDLPDRRSPNSDSKSNLDHVVVSSAGIFLLDSKLLGGAVSIQRETVRVQRRDDEEGSYDLWWLARTMRGRARRLQEDIEQATGIRSVLAVVVLWNEFSAGLVERDGLVFVAGKRLASWLEQLPKSLERQQVASVAACVKAKRPREHRFWRG
jgi:Nuclease-related domain